MTKILAAAGVLAIAGSAMATSFGYIGIQIGANDASGLNTGTFTPLATNGGVAIVGDTFTGPLGAFVATEAPTATLFGPNFGGPADFTGAEAPDWFGHWNNAPQAGNSGFANGNTSVFWNYSAAQSAYLNGDAGEALWLGQIFTGDGELDGLEVSLLTVPATDSAPASGPTFTLDNPVAFDPTSGLELELVADGNDYFIQVVPAPGAAALLGLAGVAGIRRRRA